ncbi:MAG: ribonuclease P protein component [Bacteroidota bacterium]
MSWYKTKAKGGFLNGVPLKNVMKNTFKKAERLSRRKHIQELFNKGSSFYLYPFKTLFLPSGELDPKPEFHQILISVPKRNFKRAVDRNLLKRRIREAYRLNKSIIEDTEKLLIAYIYTSKEILAYAEIEKKLVAGLVKLSHKGSSND